MVHLNLSAFFFNVFLALVTSVAWLVVAFATSRVVKRHAIVDVFWGAGFLVIYLESLLSSWWQSGEASSPWWSSSSAGARWFILFAVAVWALRLSIYLALRQRGQGEDSRYEMILRGARGRNENVYALKVIYLTQAMLLWFISIPLQWVAFSPRFSITVLTIALIVVALGLGFEATGDFQLRRFLADSANRGTTMNRGLWKYTRHPNYFGDAVVWWGFFLCAASTGWGILTIMSPLVMTRLLTSVSGKPLLEGKLRKHRAGYEEYVATTSGFVPRPPRKVANS